MVEFHLVPGSTADWQAHGAAFGRIATKKQIIERVNDQLAEQFHVEINHTHSFWGLCTRLCTKLAARPLCIYLNRLLGNADFQHIKA